MSATEKVPAGESFLTLSAKAAAAKASAALIEADNLSADIVDLLSVMCVAAAQYDDGSQFSTLGRVIEAKVVEVRAHIEGAREALRGRP